MALTEKLTAIADAIRDKTGGTEAMTLDEMPTEIAGIQAGGGGGDSYPELIYETTFTVDETIASGGSATTVCTISTGLAVDFIKHPYYEPFVVALELVEAVSADDTAVADCFSHCLHFGASHQGSVSMTTSNQAFYIDVRYPSISGYRGLYVSTATADLSSITINNRPANTSTAAGTYKIKIYRLGFECGKAK